MTENRDYVHGYCERESTRLVDQANTLTELLHGDTRYPAGSRVLEAGCGVGAQTVTLAKNSPEAEFTSVDVSNDSLSKARARIEHEGFENVTFQQANIYNVPFPEGSFDHVFVCFVLEHLEDPVEALKRLTNVLKPGGTITVLEGDHGSAYFYPESQDAVRAISCLVETQARMRGNALIGRQLFPLLQQAGFRDVSVSPQMVYVDSSKPELVEGFTRNTFIAMVEGVEEEVLSHGLIDAESWEKGIADLHRTTHSDGTFCYTFFKAMAIR
jgi:ubiquinone/menaquinone biosynthesis C-methylase UbiE